MSVWSFTVLFWFPWKFCTTPTCLLPHTSLRYGVLIFLRVWGPDTDFNLLTGHLADCSGRVVFTTGVKRESSVISLFSCSILLGTSFLSFWERGNRCNSRGVSRGPSDGTGEERRNPGTEKSKTSPAYRRANVRVRLLDVILRPSLTPYSEILHFFECPLYSPVFSYCSRFICGCRWSLLWI